LKPDQTGLNSSRHLANSLFAAALREALVCAFGKVPSAAKFADAFNLRAHGSSTISRETARKWLQGHCMPEIGKMRILIQWLKLDPASFLQSGESSTDSPASTHIDSSSTSKSGIQEALIGLLRHLDHQSIETLYLTATAMKALKRNQEAAATPKQIARSRS
jgi:hypothetical protein